MIFLEIVYFFLWTLVLYWIHRFVHRITFLKKYHLAHHKFINENDFNKSFWQLNNLILYNDNWKSTIDLWLTEVFPTIIFSIITGSWWIFFFYYSWAAFFQEMFEHKKGLSIPVLTCGDWHLEHHKNYKINYGIFFPLWDIFFRTNKSK
jgi:sterol desaturase/sphingolipid hydroxylase (fatty acid hydroxylase superfamily)